MITQRRRACRYWNWWCGTSYGRPGVRDARSSVNGHTAVPNADGTVTVVVSRGATAHPNSLTTLGYPRGNLAFRWFLADQVPDQPSVRLVKLSDAPVAVT